MMLDAAGADRWPPLPLDEWRETYETLHMWTQMVGKTRLALAPPVNHWWHVALYVSAHGLTTGPMPFEGGTLDAEFDFIRHELVLRTDAGDVRTIPLRARAVADFYADYLAALRELRVAVRLWPMPVEVERPTRFSEDRVHAAYDPDYASRFWRILARSDDVLKRFRGEFLGKCSPVHFFWGGFDLAVTRFSGRRAPPRPGADAVQSEAYSHEVISAGFWPGGGATPEPAFYAYAVPEPEGLRDVKPRPAAARWDATMGEFILPYEAVRSAASPDEALMEFLKSTYEAAAERAGWDRAALERPASAAR